MGGGWPIWPGRLTVALTASGAGKLQPGLYVICTLSLQGMLPCSSFLGAEDDGKEKGWMRIGGEGCVILRRIHGTCSDDDGITAMTAALIVRRQARA
jgi:hypothetical protein